MAGPCLGGSQEGLAPVAFHPPRSRGNPAPCVGVKKGSNSIAAKGPGGGNIAFLSLLRSCCGSSPGSESGPGGVSAREAGAAGRVLS
jgi:hypothetical protein